MSGAVKRSHGIIAICATPFESWTTVAVAGSDAETFAEISVALLARGDSVRDVWLPLTNSTRIQFITVIVACAAGLHGVDRK